MSAAEQQQRLSQLLSEMPKHERQALMLHDAHGFEIAAIAAALDRDQADIEANLRNAREKLRMALFAAD
ncbi:MAG: sigma-70 region 4 domain-containing protein [Candidatus Paceibacterota bacterium]